MYLNVSDYLCFCSSCALARSRTRRWWQCGSCLEVSQSKHVMSTRINDLSQAASTVTEGQASWWSLIARNQSTQCLLRTPQNKMKKVSISQPTFQRNHTVKSISFGLPQNRRTLTQPLTWRSHGWCIYKHMAEALHSSTWHRTRCGFAPSREPTNPAPGSQHHRHFAKSCLSFERDTLKNLTNMKKYAKCICWCQELTSAGHLCDFRGQQMEVKRTRWRFRTWSSVLNPPWYPWCRTSRFGFNVGWAPVSSKVFKHSATLVLHWEIWLSTFCTTVFGFHRLHPGHVRGALGGRKPHRYDLRDLLVAIELPSRLFRDRAPSLVLNSNNQRRPPMDLHKSNWPKCRSQTWTSGFLAVCLQQSQPSHARGAQIISAAFCWQFHSRPRWLFSWAFIPRS